MESAVDRSRSTARALHARLRSAPPEAGSWSSLVWVPAIALVFYFLSNPLALEPDFSVSYHHAVLVTVCAVVLTLPWFRLPRLPWAIGLLLLLMVGSMMWSIAPSLTWLTFLLYLKLALVGLVCAACAAPRTIAYGVLLGGVIVITLSIYAYLDGNLAAAVEPGTDGYLAGVGTNRNILAYTLILAFAAGVAVVPRQRWARAAWGACFAMVCVGLFLSQSGTGFVAAGLLAAAAGALAGVRRWRGALTRRGRRVLSVGGVVVLLGAVLGWPALGVLLGRDSATLSGRTDLWRVIWKAVADERLLGQGWGTVWGHPWAPAPMNDIFESIYVATLIPYTHGHNSLFDVLPEVGLLGVLLVLVAHVAVLRRGWARTRVPATSAALDDEWTTAVLTIVGVLAMMLFGVTEPMATIPLGWFFLVTLSGVGAARPARRRGTRAHRAAASTQTGTRVSADPARTS